MYLWSRRVRRPDGKRAIHSRLTSHGDRLWSGQPPFSPEQDPGELVRERIELAGDGLRVLSSFELLTSDATDVDEVIAEFEDVVADERLAPPFVRVTGLCWFRYALHYRPRVTWRTDFRSLFARGIHLL